MPTGSHRLVVARLGFVPETLAVDVRANLENLGDVRMTKHHPLVRPARGEGGRWTTDAWAPLDGRVVNAGLRIDLGRT